MAGGEDIKLGPFITGLDTYSDAASIPDTALVECTNFELDLDGSLVSRPPIVSLGATMPLAATGNMRILNYYITDAGAPYLIGTDGNSSTYYFNGTSWTLITNTFAAAAMVQFKNELWLVAPLTSANPGGKWSPSGGFTAVASMPKGACIVSHKERMWIGLGKNAQANGTRMYLSAIVSGAPAWNGDFIDVGQGDGQNIVDLCIYGSDIVIFKEGSTYRFNYDSDPAVGTVQRVSDNIGAMDVNCWASYENQLYVLFDNKVYQFSNYNYDRLNSRVPLKANNPSTSLSEYATISVWSDRLFVSFFDVTYVYSLRTRTWSIWKSSVLENIGRVVLVPGEQNVVPLAYTYSTKPRENTLYKIEDRVADTVGESMVCTMQTKNYDYQVSQRFKRLFWWGVDAYIRTGIDAYALPVSYSARVTWDQLAAYTWDQLSVYTWDRPLDVSLVIADTVSTQGITGGRKFIKFLKSLRFRQVAFRLVATTEGTSATAPVRVYNIMTMVKDKQTVSKRIS